MDTPYVYALIDPRDGATFYIGKGTGRRMYQHEKDVKRGGGVNAAKCTRIGEILAAGMNVRHEILSKHATEALAYAAERDAIAAHKALTNANAGGGGSWCGAVGSGHERQESPAVTLRNARGLMNRLVPYLQWMQERPRSADEVAARSWVFDRLAEVIAMCEAKIGLPKSSSSRQGSACPA